jgi:UDP-N-acetylglucosamine transferase subunit ALG13
VILVAVGTQFPFDRMIEAVDTWAESAGRTDVVAQVGPSDYAPRALKCFGMMPPDEFIQLQRDAEVIVAHAGMGSILGALEAGTPIVIMPRIHALGEHRNDHQLATARQFADVLGVYVAANERELRGYLDRIGELTSSSADTGASEVLIERLRAFVTDSRAPIWRRSFD